jgi:hypothetical protein
VLPGGVVWKCRSQADYSNEQTRRYVAGCRNAETGRVVSGRIAKWEARDVRQLTTGRVQSASDRTGFVAAKL